MHGDNEAAPGDGLAALTARIDELAARVEKLTRRARKVRQRLRRAKEWATRTPPIDPEKLYTPQEVRARFRCDMDTVDLLLDAQEIRACYLAAEMDSGMDARIKGSDLAAFIISREQGGP